MKSALIATALCLLAGCSTFVSAAPPPAAAPVQPDPDSGVERLLDATVGLVNPDSGGAYCAGVHVGPVTIMTAAHCVGEAGDDVDVGWRSAYRPSGEDDDLSGVFEYTFRYVVAATYPAHDLAVLVYGGAASLPGHAQVPIRTAPIWRGLEVVSVGHPGGVGYWYSVGHVVAPILPFTTDGQPETSTGVSLLLWPGYSGGPVVDRAGALIGVNSWTHPSHPWVSGITTQQGTIAAARAAGVL